MCKIDDNFVRLNTLIEERIETCYQADDKQNACVQVVHTILAAMAQDCRMLIPVQTPENALKFFDPAKIEKGQIIQPDEDMHFKLIHYTDPEGKRCMPVFTSSDKKDEAGLTGCSILSYYLEEYMRQVLDMPEIEGILINPGIHSFYLSKDTIAQMLEDYEQQRNWVLN